MMSKEEIKICDDWGWYYDTEDQGILNRPIIYTRQIYNSIEEETYTDDEYEYYMERKIDTEDIDELTHHNNHNNSKKKSVNDYDNGFLIKVGSRTIITALLFYVVFFAV